LIRHATLDDLNDMKRIRDSAFKADAWSDSSLILEFHKDYSAIYIYELNNYIIAYMIIWDIIDIVEVVTFAVDEPYQNQGIGSIFLQNILSEYINHTWVLEVNESNIKAINIYKSFNFKDIGIIKNYYGNNRNAIRMILEAKANSD